MKSTEIEALAQSQPAPREDYNQDWETAAGTPGAPKIPPLSPEGKTRDIASKADELILKKIELIKKEGGLIFIGTSVFTDTAILKALQEVDCFSVINKCSSHARIVNIYNNLSCKYTRDLMPGNILPYLENKQGPDQGILDTVRMTGNFYDTMRLRINENRPLFHISAIGGIIPQKKNEWSYPFVFKGKRNLSEGAHGSFEEMAISTDNEYVKYWYDRICFYYSISHNLCNFQRGIGTDFRWKKKKVHYQKLPTCPDCGETSLFSNFWLLNPYGPARKVLRCLQCNELLVNEVLP